jgi:4-hydroxy-tetrahydrodipicolinate reductase
MSRRKYRVIQWATGNTGRRSLEAVIRHRDLDLVGLWVSAQAKVGKDAGAIAGLPATGVIASNSVDEMIALDADCVLYMRQGIDWDEVCRILASGKNIVTTRGEFHSPAFMRPERRERIEAACAKGNSSIHSTGSTPGFITEALPIPLLALSRSLECLTIHEYADMATHDSPDMMFRIVGFGSPPEAFDERKVNHVKRALGGSLSQLFDAIGLPLDEITAHGEMAPAARDITLAAGTVRAGTAAAQRTVIEGMHNGRRVLRFIINWYCSTDIVPQDWDLRESGWRVMVEGDTPLKVDISFPVSAERYPLVAPGYTAHPAVNAVPAVCDAPPGIRTSMDLHVIPHFA